MNHSCVGWKLSGVNMFFSDERRVSDVRMMLGWTRQAFPSSPRFLDGWSNSGARLNIYAKMDATKYHATRSFKSAAQISHVFLVPGSISSSKPHSYSSAHNVLM